MCRELIQVVIKIPNSQSSRQLKLKLLKQNDYYYINSLLLWILYIITALFILWLLEIVLVLVFLICISKILNIPVYSCINQFYPSRPFYLSCYLTYDLTHFWLYIIVGVLLNENPARINFAKKLFFLASIVCVCIPSHQERSVHITIYWPEPETSLVRNILKREKEKKNKVK